MKILAIQNRMGIGDMVIFLPFIQEISRKFGCPISLLVKESSKADQYLKNSDYIDEIISLKREDKNRGDHDGIKGFVKLSNELKSRKFEKVIIFNSSLRYNLICKFANIKEIYHYPLFEKKGQHVINTAKKLLKDKLNLEVNSNPVINIETEKLIRAKSNFNFEKKEKNFLLGIGGSGPSKRVPAEKFLELIKYCKEKYDCQFFLATGKKDEEQEIKKDILKIYKDDCISLDDLIISDILPVIKNCDLSVCNDSSFSHLSSSLNIPTIVLMCDTPLLYGNYNSNMFPILPDGVDNVTHGTNGKNKINPKKIFDKIISLIN